MTIAGTVDQHVDRADQLFEGRYRHSDCAEVSHIQNDNSRAAVGGERLQRIPILLAPDRSDDRMSCLQTRLKKSTAEPGAGAGDEESLAMVLQVVHGLWRYDCNGSDDNQQSVMSAQGLSSYHLPRCMPPSTCKTSPVT